MITWIKAHKVLTSVSCLLLAAALVGTTLLVSGRVNTVSGSAPVYGVYARSASAEEHGGRKGSEAGGHAERLEGSR